MRTSVVARLAILGGCLVIALFGCDVFQGARNPLDSSAARILETELLAGGSQGSADGTGSAASFGHLTAMCSDGTKLYVCDQTAGTIRAVAPTTGAVTTLAGPSSVSAYGICSDGTSLYWTGTTNGVGNCVWKVSTSGGTPTVVAGSGTAGRLDATGSSAQFSTPEGICTDGTYLYVADAGNNCIRRAAISDGVVTTIAGDYSSGSSGNTNATGLAARFANPWSVCLWGTSHLCVADSNGGTRIIDLSTSAVSTATYYNDDNGNFELNAWDGTEFLYGSDSGTGIAKVQPTTSPWGKLWADSTSHIAINSPCFCGGDLWVMDQGTYGVYKVLGIK